MDDVLEVKPLLPQPGSSEAPIKYFLLEGLRYHNHDLTIVFDSDGTRYHLGPGITIFSDNKPLIQNAPLGPVTVPLHSAPSGTLAHANFPELRENLAVNVWGRAPGAFERDLPIASASSMSPEPETIDAVAPQLYQPIDGRQWFFPETRHGWSPETNPGKGADSDGWDDWYSVDLRQATSIGSVEAAFFDDGKEIAVPARIQVQTRASGMDWVDFSNPITPLANGVSVVSGNPTTAQEVRLRIQRNDNHHAPRLIQIKIFAPAASGTKAKER
jgi:hypothetical protein